MRERVTANGRNLRMTPGMRKVLAAIVDAPGPTWGFRICEATGIGPGSVYPVLEKLVNAGLIRSEWETPVSEDRPQRLYYHPAFTPSWYRANGLLAPHN